MAVMSRRKRRNRIILYAVLICLAVLVLVSVRSGWLVGSASDSTGIGRTGKVHPRLQDHDLLNYDKPLEELIGASEEVNEAVSILIEKSKCRLSVLLRGQVVKQYPVVFGDNVEDDKFMRGDGRVPEGRFRILKLYPHDSWSKYMRIDYPNRRSWEKHERAKRDGIIPADAGIKANIGIHGVPQGEDYLVEEGTGWTGGCTAMTRADVDEVYLVCRKGTRVDIVK